MVQLVNNENSYRIIMDKNTNVKVRDVYNRIFFSTIGLDGIRIYGKDPMPDIKDDVIELSESESESEEDSDERIIRTFGNEQPDSGYSKLPLYNNLNDDSDSEEKSVDKADKNDEGMYNFLGDYVLKYLNRDDGSKPNENTFEVYIPLDIKNPVISLENITLLDDTNSLLVLSLNGITYKILERIVQDLYQQIVYLSDLGYFYTSIELSSVFLIQNRYVVFDSTVISKFDDENTEDLNQRKNAFIEFIIRLTKTDTIENLLEKIQYTDIFFFLKRVQENSIFVMV